MIIQFFLILKCWNVAQLLWNSTSLKHLNRQETGFVEMTGLANHTETFLLLNFANNYFAYSVQFFKCGQ